MSQEYKVLCFIPMRNCQSTIGNLIQRFEPNLLKHISEILVVDNASDDGSLDEARRALAKITGPKTSLFQNGRNYGLGGSHKIAFNYAWENDFDYIFVVHGDNSSDPNAFKPYLERDLGKFEMILSDRLHGDFPRAGYPKSRLIFNRLLSILASLLMGKKVRDYGGGPVNIFRVSSFLNKYENPLKGFSSEVEFNQHALTYGVYRRMNFKFVPVEFSEIGTKTPRKLISQFLKPLIFSLRFRFSPKKTIAQDLKGSFFGQNYLKVNINSESIKTPIVPKKRVDDQTKNRMLDLAKMTTNSEVRFPYLDVNGLDVVRIKMELKPWHLTGNFLESHITHLLKTIDPNRLILDIYGDDVVKSKQCYDFLTFCLDRGVEPQLITRGVGDINLWRNYAKLVKNLTINYQPGEIQRSFFFDLCKEIAPMGNISVNILTHQEHFYHAVGLREKIAKEMNLRSLLLQPYSLESNAQLPEDHMQILLDQTAVVHTWFKGNVFRKHSVYSFGEALKNSERFEEAKTFGFMEIAPRKILKEKVRTFKLNTLENEASLFG